MVAISLPQLITERTTDEDDSGSPLEEISKRGNSLRTSFENTTSKISPVAFVDGQTRTFLKGKLHENQALIWRSCVEASIYCAIFHEMKRVLKNRTANHRWVWHMLLSSFESMSSITVQGFFVVGRLYTQYQPDKPDVAVALQRACLCVP
ncbi:hypothetical protein ABBQ32_002440 [Trebouxia sp. C0010 RCD-2024]